MNLLRTTRALAVVLVVIGLAGAVRALTGSPVDLVLVEPAGIDVGVRLDVLSSLLLAFVASLSWLVARYSGRNLAGQRRTTRFGALQLTVLVSLAVLVTGASLPVVAAGWTVSGLVLAALVSHAGTPQAVRAARYVRRRFLLGDVALWAGVVLAVVMLPTVDRAGLSALVAGPGVDPVAATLVGVVLLVACVVRSALVPAHRWLPETAEAPSPVSALLHAGIVNGTAVLLGLFWPLVSGAPVVLALLVAVGAASVAVGTLAARARADVKGRLACSTTAQMGYMTLQLGLGLPAAAVLHLVGHGYYKSWLFLRAGGAVQRQRQAPVTGTATPWSGRSARVLPAVAASAVLVLLLGAPALVAAVGSLGPVALVPALLAALAAAVGTGSVALVPAVRTRTLLGVATILSVAAAGYLWLLGATETVLSDALPKQAVWSTGVAVALVVALVAGAALLLAAAAGRREGVRPLDVALTGSALAPWSTRIGGTARLPRLARRMTQDPPGSGSPDVPGTTPDPAQVAELVRAAARLVGPAWPARTIVAANPLSGLEHEPFEQATARVGTRLGTEGVLPLAEYARLLDEGRIAPEHLAAALRQQAEDAGATPVDDASTEDGPTDDDRVAALVRRARDATAGPRTGPAPRTFCAAVDRMTMGTTASGAGAQETAVQHAATWTQRAWPAAVEGDEQGPWTLWRSVAGLPRHDRALGLRGTAALVRDMPEDPAEALSGLLGAAGVTTEQAGDYLESVLASAPGWAAHAAWRARRLGTDRPLLELLALRVALDLLVAGARTAEVGTDVWAGTPAAVALPGTSPAEQLRDRHTWQLAYELGYQDRLLGALAPSAQDLALGAGESGSDARAQLVMCIDVRSERLRRRLEATGAWQTFGFAGFFGVDLDLVAPGGARYEQCPALIRPGRTVTATARPTTWRDGLGAAVTAVGAAPLTPLLLAEAAGVAAGAAAIARTVAPSRWARACEAWSPAGGPWEHDGGSLRLDADLTTRVALAAGALRGMGLVDGFAPLLVLVGHASRMQNNAFATAYDCGACGGNGGQVNAQVLAALLEDRQVRDGLREQGIDLPDGTVAVAAVHVTTTDEVLLDPSVELPASHREHGEQLRAALARAGAEVRAERARTLPGAPAGTRAEDWAQPCPEWGLAGNAALVIGPRSLTADLDLDGRVFLHSYDPALDPDSGVLTTLLTAPLVVTQWINSQYYASTVDPDVLGAGDKTTHNVVGDVGVLTGAHGDLRLGLPWQSLFSADPATGGGARRHEPLRLLGVVWADPEAVLSVVREHGPVADLVRNGWIRLVVLDPADGRALRLSRSLTWLPVPQGQSLAA